MKKLNLINSKTVFFSSIIVLFTITLIVYLTGLKDHRSLYINSLLATTIILLVFFIFIVVGLYNGWKMKENLGDFSNHFSKLKKPGSTNGDFNFSGMELPEVDSIEGCIFGIIAWLLIAVFGTIILWTIGAFFWGVLLLMAGLLYWIIFRAFRLILRHSAVCKGNVFKSLQIALLYSFLYSAWIYAIILCSHYFVS